ncbi:MAG: transposase [Phycisphaeraceae bacterium]|nr:transposase [Phycisphaeraceae bacterium]
MATSVRKRRRFSAQLKARVALEVVREQKTIAQLAGQYQVHPNQISEWWKQLPHGAEELFAGGLAMAVHKVALPRPDGPNHSIQTREETSLWSA